MVLFYEDEKKLKPPLTPLRRRLRFVFRFVLVIAAMLTLSLVFMNTLGGTGDTLRLSAEDYLHRLTGLEVHIGNFERVTFFPEVSVNMGDVSFRREKDAPPTVMIGSMNFAMSFLDVFLRRGRVRALEIKDAHFDAGVITAGALDVSRIGIDVSEQEKNLARVSIDGAHNQVPFDISMTLAAHDIGGGKKDFRHPTKSAIEINSSFLKAAGAMFRLRGGGVQFDFDGVGVPDAVMKGRMILRREAKSLLLSADFTSLPGATATLDGLEKVYCSLKPPGHAMIPRMKMGVITIDGQSKMFLGECSSLTPEQKLP